MSVTRVNLARLSLAKMVVEMSQDDDNNDDDDDDDDVWVRERKHDPLARGYE